MVALWARSGLFYPTGRCSEVIGFNFHMTTYLAVVACWSFCLALILVFNIVSRRKRNNSMQPCDFSVDRSGDTIFIQGTDSRFEFPAISLEALRFPDNILIFRNGVAISISPRNENLEDGKTVEDIENLIQRA